MTFIFIYSCMYIFTVVFVTFIIYLQLFIQLFIHVYILVRVDVFAYILYKCYNIVAFVAFLFVYSCVYIFTVVFVIFIFIYSCVRDIYTEYKQTRQHELKYAHVTTIVYTFYTIHSRRIRKVSLHTTNK